MSTFYIGQSVRINCPESRWHGPEAFVTSALKLGLYLGRPESFYQVTIKGGLCQDVSDSGNGKLLPIGFAPHELEPLTPPNQKEFVAEEEIPYAPDFTIRAPGVAA